MTTLHRIFLALIAAFAMYSCVNGPKKLAQADYRVIPLPLDITARDGAPFKFSPSTKIVIPEGNEKIKRNAEFLADFLHQITGIKPALTTATSDKNAIILSLGQPNDAVAEAYSLKVNQNTIEISGASEAGIFYGIQTLRKATPITEGNVIYPPVEIEDRPRFGYRGMMLDVARHFEPVDFIKKYIDLLALHHINRFHWHLTEDQGWRIEIKKYPRLTEIGSVRNETVIGKNSGKYDGKPHGGFYTQSEIKDIVKYGQERYITIVPEIDLPGHMLAALAAYPQLGCTGGPYEVAKTWGVFDDVLCPGNDSTFVFLEDVLTEIMDLFPSEYIHIGGDECPKVRWEKCPKCQARIKQLGLKSDARHSKEHYLQSYVTERIEKFLNDHGRKIIGWDEILEGELAPNATVMSWRGMQGGIQAAQMGHDVIMTPTDYCYFDYYQTSDADNEPLAIGGYLPLEKVYGFDPVPDMLTPGQKKHIVGVQANLWTEYIATPEQVEYMTVPRLAAMSEVQWTSAGEKNYADFLTRLPRLMALYNLSGYNCAKHIFDIKSDLNADFQTNSLDVQFSTIDGAPIYYTLDGSKPTQNSTRYDGKFSVKENSELKAVAIRRDGWNSRVFDEKISVSKSTFKPINLRLAPHPSYTFKGAGALVDGILANTTNYRTGKWIGFQQNDLIADIDLLEPTTVSNMEIHCCVSTGDWIFDAGEISIASSGDGETFSPVKQEKIQDNHNADWSEIVKHDITFNPATARYFRITIKPSIIPQWHTGRGGKAFVFVDEIVLN